MYREGGVRRGHGFRTLRLSASKLQNFSYAYHLGSRLKYVGRLRHVSRVVFRSTDKDCIVVITRFIEWMLRLMDFVCMDSWGVVHDGACKTFVLVQTTSTSDSLRPSPPNAHLLVHRHYIKPHYGLLSHYLNIISPHSALTTFMPQSTRLLYVSRLLKYPFWVIGLYLTFPLHSLSWGYKKWPDLSLLSL